MTDQTDQTDQTDSRHRCPHCDEPTTYQAFSGGREWYCKGCDMDGPYPAEATGPRARLLADPGGVGELRRQMRDELAARATLKSSTGAQTQREG